MLNLDYIIYNPAMNLSRVPSRCPDGLWNLSFRFLGRNVELRIKYGQIEGRQLQAISIILALTRALISNPVVKIVFSLSTSIQPLHAITDTVYFVKTKQKRRIISTSLKIVWYVCRYGFEELSSKAIGRIPAIG